jgi:predicted Rossmann fold nucleotide-binding protein DprA/Smf involved in DNA uptake
MSLLDKPKPKIDYVHRTDPRYPAALSVLGDRAPSSLALVGNAELLGEDPLALFCSIKCPGSLILKTYDLAQKLRETNATVISGFHSPVERECLDVLLNSNANLIICPARGLESMRIPREYRKPIDAGRLLLVSAFTEKQRQPNSAMTERRNRFVAALAEKAFVAHAELRGKTEVLCKEIVCWGKPLFTFEEEANENLVALGAETLKLDTPVSEKLSGWIVEDYIAERAKRASREQFERALQQVPDVEPEEIDRL